MTKRNDYCFDLKTILKSPERRLKCFCRSRCIQVRVCVCIYSVCTGASIDTIVGHKQHTHTPKKNHQDARTHANTYTLSLLMLSSYVWMMRFAYTYAFWVYLYCRKWKHRTALPLCHVKKHSIASMQPAKVAGLHLLFICLVGVDCVFLFHFFFFAALRIKNCLVVRKKWTISNLLPINKLIKIVRLKFGSVLFSF